MTFGTVVRGIVKPFWKLLYPMRVEGLENFKQEGSFVLCANHRSNIDVVALYIAAPRQLYFMAKEELFRFKPLGWLIRKLGAFPVRRNQTDLCAVKTALRILKDGKVLGIFPQGTRTDDLEDKSAKAGAVVIANKAHVPIVPAAIISDYKLFHKTRVKFGQPIYDTVDQKKINGEDIQTVVGSVMREIRTLWEEDAREN